MYRVYLAFRAEKDIKKLTSRVKGEIRSILRVLTDNPYKGTTLLGKYKGLRRYRVGDFRIVYELNKKKKTLTIIKIGHRRDIYR